LNPENFRREVGKNIRKYRKIKGYTQAELSKLVGLKSKGNTISDIETGKNLFPLQDLPKYIEALDCKIEDLLTPLFKKTKTEFDLFCDEIKQIWNIKEAKDELQRDLNLIKKAYNIKTPGAAYTEEKEKRIQRGDG